MNDGYKRLMVGALVVLLSGVFIFAVSGVVDAFDEFEIEEEPAEEPPVEEEPAFEEEPPGEEPEEIDPWLEGEPEEEPGLSAREVVENTCEGIPGPDDVVEDLRPLMRVEVANLALNIEGEFFERPDACEEVLEDWLQD